MVISEGCKGKEILCPYDGRWYKKGVEYNIDFSLSLRMRGDKDFVVDMVNEHYSYYPSTWKVDREVGFVSDIDAQSGWGNVGSNLVKYSPHIKFAHVGRKWGVNEPLVNAAARREVNPNAAMLWHQQPKQEWEESPFGRNIAITPFETTQVPPTWVPRFNAMDAVLVPCVQNIQMMQDSGVKVPVDLIHWGVDKGKFHPVERKAGRPFTFGHMGALSKRKGTDILVRAFQAAFPKDPNVRLMCKTSNRDYPFMVFNEPRIKVKVGPTSRQELMDDFFSEIDCFVFPTKGEGFGLTPLEAMATGVPAIVTGWSGPVEYMKDEVGWSLDYSMGPAVEFEEHTYKEPCGDWAIPSFDHLVETLRWAYEHPHEVRQKGIAAAEYVASEWGWEDQIGMFHNALDKYL
jgi:glycosyltransferase involved in cell wall biosynthesis